MLETGGVPLSGYKLYALNIGDNVESLAYDGTDHPEITQVTISALALDQDYSFKVTGLNPYEGEPGDASSYRLGGRPEAPG